MQLVIKYGVVDLTPDMIKEYKENNRFVQLVETSNHNDLVIGSKSSHDFYITPDDVLCDFTGLSNDREKQKAVVYYTENKRPKLLPDRAEALVVNFNLESIKEFEHSAFNTYYCRKLFKKEDLLPIYRLMEFVIPDLSNLSEIYLNRQKVEKKNYINIPICYWTKNGIICDSPLPFLFLHSDKVTEIPIVFIIDKDHKEIDLDFLPKPFFKSTPSDNSKPLSVDECAFEINGLKRNLIKIPKNFIEEIVLDRNPFHLPIELEQKVLELGIQEIMHFFPNREYPSGVCHSKYSSTQNSYRIFLDKGLEEYPGILIEDQQGNDDALHDFFKNKIANLSIKEITKKSVEGKILYTDLFEILEPISLDKASLTTVLPDKRLTKDLLQVNIDSTDPRVHIIMFGSFLTINLNILKSYSQNDLIPIVVHYAPELSNSKKVRALLLNKIKTYDTEIR